MYRHPLWILFLSFIVIGVIGYSIHSSWQLWKYLRLNTQAPVQGIQWSVIALSDEEFVPFARYEFHVNQINYQGETFWKEIYLNQWSAQESIHRFSLSPQVWFNASCPEISSLQKKFPFKEVFSTFLLWIIGIYFFCLSYYVQKYHHNK